MPESAPTTGDVAEPDRLFLSPQQVADIVGLHPAVIRRAIDRGELRGYKLCSKLRISRQDLAHWLDRSLVRTYDP
jgi:excisionase family DNA binding protein